MHDSHAKKQKYFHHFYLCRHIYVVKLLNSILVSSFHSAYTVPEILIINTHYNKKENMMASQDSSFNCKFCGQAAGSFQIKVKLRTKVKCQFQVKLLENHRKEVCLILCSKLSIPCYQQIYYGLNPYNEVKGCLSVYT